MSEIKQKVQAQFGRSANAYVTSSVHASGYSLQRLIELVEPQPDWHVLDIATGGGHTAVIFAPHVRAVVATDITQPMLDAAQAFAHSKGLSNITFEYADAGDLPFPDDTFDLVTCRIAAHHFPDVFKFLQECQRVLKPNGVLAIVDNSVPAGSGGAYINAFEKLRDPSHVRCLSAEEWEQEVFAAGFDVTVKEFGRMQLDFHAWTTRMHVPDDDRTRLKVLLKQAPPEAYAVLTPTFEGDRIHFYLERMILIAIRR